MANGTQPVTQVTPEICGGLAAMLRDQAKTPSNGPPRGVEPGTSADVVPPWPPKGCARKSVREPLKDQMKKSAYVSFSGTRADWTTNPARNLGRDS